MEQENVKIIKKRKTFFGQKKTKLFGMKLPLMETFENAKKCQNSKPSPEKWMKNFSRQKMCGQQNEKKNKKQVFRSKT